MGTLGCWASEFRVAFGGIGVELDWSFMTRTAV